ncbi:MAG TPA: MBL fold metallo-hydrolase, partial [bacterium]|nr:MBL fold metallo-hydrolase [bacterium]
MLSILPLGCYGSDLENKKCITMQVTPSTVIDTGALLSSLDTPQLVDIRNVIITHCHFDHIKNLPIFSDFMLSLGG